MAESTIKSSYVCEDVSFTTSSSAGLTTNSTAIKRNGNLCIAYIAIRNSNGFSADNWIKVHTVSVTPKNEIDITTTWNDTTATVELRTNGDIYVYAHGQKFTGFLRAIIPFFI